MLFGKFFILFFVKFNFFKFWNGWKKFCVKKLILLLLMYSFWVWKFLVLIFFENVKFFKVLLLRYICKVEWGIFFGICVMLEYLIMVV